MTTEHPSSTRPASSLFRYRHIRTTTGGPQRHIYLDVELEHSSTFQSLEDEDDLRLLIHSSIARLFGEAGYSIQFEVLKFRVRPSTRAFIRVLTQDYARFRIALLLTTDPYEEELSVPRISARQLLADPPKCWFKIHRTAHSLATLAFKWEISDHVDEDDGGGLS